jgi:putative heme transporter
VADAPDDDRRFVARVQVREPQAQHEPAGATAPGTGGARTGAGGVPTGAGGPSEGSGLRTAPSPYLRIGRYAWATLGVVGVLVVAGIVVGELALLVVPLVLALFPAALLMPVAQWLKEHGVPASIAALLTVLGGFAAIAAVVALLVPIVANEVPELVDSIGDGVGELEGWLADDPLGVGWDFEGFGELLEQGRDQLGSLLEGGGVAGGAMTAVTRVFEGVTALLLMIVAIFFYLKDDGKLARGVIRTLPETWRPHATALGDRFWTTTGRYFRGQLLVALVDAVFIGLGLLLLGVPLAIPLAVLVFFGGLFPIIGAVVTGAVAVLVALADTGPLMALAVAGLVLAVQQAESNILEPLILARVIRLHPLMVLTSITAGAVLLGVLGAFLAVPIAASIARGVDYVRGEEPEEAGPVRHDPEDLVPDHAE